MSNTVDTSREAVKAAAYLRDCCGMDPDLRYTLAALAHGAGYKDFFAWAADNPEKTIDIAETQREILEDEGLMYKGLQKPEARE